MFKIRVVPKSKICFKYSSKQHVIGDKMALSDKRPPQMFPEFHKCPPGGQQERCIRLCKLGPSLDQVKTKVGLEWT